MMKKRLIWLLLVLMIFPLFGCNEIETNSITPQVAQMLSICELATTKCYCHNVAKFFKEYPNKFWWWQKDTEFWAECTGEVTLGIDVSQVVIDIKGKEVYITLPPAEVLDCKIEQEGLSSESFYVAKNSATPTAEDGTQLLGVAKQQMIEQFAGDKILLNDAQRQTQRLLEEYVHNIGKATGVQYTVYFDGAAVEDNKDATSQNTTTVTENTTTTQVDE